MNNIYFSFLAISFSFSSLQAQQQFTLGSEWTREVFHSYQEGKVSHFLHTYEQEMQNNEQNDLHQEQSKPS